MDMECIDNEIASLSEELSKWKVGSPEHKAIIDALKELHAIRMNERRAESERIEKNMTIDLRKEELEVRILESEQKLKASKHADWFGFLKSIACGLLAIGGMFCLDEIKTEQGYLDKDKFSIIRTLFPKI